MKRKMKMIGIAMSTAVLLSAVTGCTSTEGGSSAQNNAASEAPAQRYKMSYFNDKIAQTIPNGYAMKFVSEKFGVDLEFLPRDADKNIHGQEILVKIASGEIPDTWMDVPMPVYDKLVAQGAVAEIPPDLIEQYSPKYMAWLKKHLGDNPFKYWMRDGKNYSMPIIWTIGVNGHVLGFRQDWLEKVGITKTPETIEEMEVALRKFRNEDPDGNGKKDTYGWTGRGDILTEVFAPIFGAYGLYPGAFTENNGKIVRGEIEPGAKEALSILNRWYKEELLDPEFIVNKSKNVDDKVISGKAGAVVRTWWNFIPREAFFGGMYADMTKKDPNIKWAITAGPKGPQGIQGMTQENPIISSGVQFGKHMEKDRDKMIKYLQISEATAFDTYYWDNIVYGELGKTYKKNPDGGYEYLPPYDKPEEQIKFGIGQQYNFMGKSFNDYEFQIPYMTKSDLMPLRKQAESTGKGKYDVLFPVQKPVFNEYSDKLEQLTMKNYVDFITGKRPLSEFDSYVDEWKNSGGTKVLEEAQQKYDEMMKNK